MNTEEEARQQDLAIVQRAVDQLGEHFDTVQVFVTKHDQGGIGGTRRVSVGCGNWYARYGQVGLWLEVERASEIENNT